MRTASEIEAENNQDKLNQFLSTGYIKKKMPNNKFFTDFVLKYQINLNDSINKCYKYRISDDSPSP